MSVTEPRYIRQLQETIVGATIRVTRKYHSKRYRCVICGEQGVNTFKDEPPLCSYHDTPPRGVRN